MSGVMGTNLAFSSPRMEVPPYRAPPIAAMRRYPLSFLILTTLGILTGLPGLAALAGFGAQWHPLLADTGTGIALVVSAIALIGSGLFPLVISRLMAQESARKE